MIDSSVKEWGDMGDTKASTTSGGEGLLFGDVGADGNPFFRRHGKADIPIFEFSAGYISKQTHPSRQLQQHLSRQTNLSRPSFDIFLSRPIEADNLQ